MFQLPPRYFAVIWCERHTRSEWQSGDPTPSRPYGKDFVWVFEISGAVPPAHLVGGYSGAVSERQPPMYFRLGGGSLKGISKAGEIVWSRVFVDGGKLKADIGRARALDLPLEETERRWQMTTPQWPIMHAVLYGITRDQMMGRHKSNHIQVAYAPSEEDANLALAAKAATLRNMGLEVSICGSDHGLGSSAKFEDQVSDSLAQSR